jgi:Glycosyl transferases group 1
VGLQKRAAIKSQKEPNMPITVGFLGNFTVNYSTESHLAWTFEHLGHKVIPFQENHARTDDIRYLCLRDKVDLFLWVRTHGWQTPGVLSLDDLIADLRANGIRTASFHLDRYFGLRLADQREDRVGNHAFWRTDYVFTADGGNQEKFKERKVNHFWLKPGVVEKACYIGRVKENYRADVAFVGSRGYHPEYPFRGQLITWLDKTYGPRFKLFGGGTHWGVVREDELNCVYASVKVVVGDSCFAGAPNYWSDRVPETCGRGGFLIHPKTEGLEIPGLAVFPAGDLAMLKEKIDYYIAQDTVRERMKLCAQAHVKINDTYTNRVTQMLKVMNLW